MNLCLRVSLIDQGSDGARSLGGWPPLSHSVPTTEYMIAVNATPSRCRSRTRSDQVIDQAGSGENRRVRRHPGCWVLAPTTAARTGKPAQDRPITPESPSSLARFCMTGPTLRASIPCHGGFGMAPDMRFITASRPRLSRRAISRIGSPVRYAASIRASCVARRLRYPSARHLARASRRSSGSGAGRAPLPRDARRRIYSGARRRTTFST